MSICNAESRDDGDRAAERRLIERVQRRDAAAMRQLIEAHQQRLYAFVWRMVRHREDAEEICQDAFLKAFAAISTFDPSYRFSTWLFTIAYRLTLNNIRRRRPVGGDFDFATLPDQQPDVSSDALVSEEAARLKQIVWDAVDALSPPQRAAVLLFYKQEHSCHEIAEVLDMPVATVKSHLHRARARLKDLLAPQVAADFAGERILGELAG